LILIWCWSRRRADSGILIGPLWFKQWEGQSLGWPRWNFDGATPNFLCWERLQLWLYFGGCLFVISAHGRLSSVTLRCWFNRFPGPTVLPMTEFECQNVLRSQNVRSTRYRINAIQCRKRDADWYVRKVSARPSQVLGLVQKELEGEFQNRDIKAANANASEVQTKETESRLYLTAWKNEGQKNNERIYSRIGL